MRKVRSGKRISDRGRKRAREREKVRKRVSRGDPQPPNNRKEASSTATGQTSSRTSTHARTHARSIYIYISALVCFFLSPPPFSHTIFVLNTPIRTLLIAQISVVINSGYLHSDWNGIMQVSGKKKKDFKYKKTICCN